VSKHHNKHKELIITNSLVLSFLRPLLQGMGTSPFMLALQYNSTLYTHARARARARMHARTHARTHTHTHTHHLTALCPGLPGWVGTRKVKPIWILLKQEIVSGSGISWAICKSAARSRQITMPAPHSSVFYRPDALPAAQPIASKHWRHTIPYTHNTWKTTNVCY